jgi:hypothetical protein
MLKQLEGTLVYVMCDKPTPCYEKEKGTEWKAGIVLTDEDTVDLFDETYPKQSAKKVKSSEFEDIYKCKLPEGAGKNVWVITLKKNTKLSNGEDVPDKYRPHVFEVNESAGKKVMTDITFTKLAGNGSKGILTIDHWAGEKGNVARLKNVAVTELIEYVKPEGSDYNPGDEFDFGDSKPAAPKAEVKKPAAKKAAKSDEDDGSPF